MNFIAKILQNAAHYSESPALYCNEMMINYAHFFDAVFKITSCLKKLDMRGVPCVILSAKSPGYLQSMFAAFLSNHIYTPINSSAPFQRNIKILSKLQTFICVVDMISIDTLCQYLPFLGSAKLVFINSALFKVVSRDSLHSDIHFVEPDQVVDCFKLNYKANDIAYLMFTSGSTGDPKGVPITFAALNAYLNNVSNNFAFSPMDHFSQLCDLAFDLSLHEMLLCFMHGGTLYIYDDEKNYCLARFLSHHNIHHMMLVPSMVPMILKQAQYLGLELDYLKQVFFCGEALPLSYAKQFQSICCKSKVINLYGPTEATIACSYHVFNNQLDYQSMSTVPIGFPFDDMHFALSDNQALMISGKQLFQGYWGVTSVSSTALYYSGDRVGLDNVFGYHFLSRVDDQWQVRGMRIERTEIEECLRHVMNEVHICIVPIYKDQLISALVVCSPSNKSIRDYDDMLREYLPDEVFPFLEYQIAEFPRLPNKKIDYRKLRIIVDNHFKLAEEVV